MPTIVMQCSGAKAEGPLASCVKYQNRAHRLVLKFMMEGGWQAGWCMAVLSAKHGLLLSTDLVDDYDEVLKDERDIPAWLARVKETSWSVDEGPVLFYGSKLYHKALEALLERRVKHIGSGGRGCGDYFQALQEGLGLYDEDC